MIFNHQKHCKLTDTAIYLLKNSTKLYLPLPDPFPKKIRMVTWQRSHGTWAKAAYVEVYLEDRILKSSVALQAAHSPGQLVRSLFMWTRALQWQITKEMLHGKRDVKNGCLHIPMNFLVSSFQIENRIPNYYLRGLHF